MLHPLITIGYTEIVMSFDIAMANLKARLNASIDIPYKLLRRGEMSPKTKALKHRASYRCSSLN
jgi:hypothetical protein